MTKHIYMIRHAKSSWEDPSLEDIDRPLNRRGLKTCYFMAEPIKEAGCDFKHVFCSPAVRARSTITLIQESLPDLPFKWQVADALYTFDSHDVLKWLQQLPETFAQVVIVGHNPAFTDLCNVLSDSSIEKIPTCGYVHLCAADLKHWGDLAEKSCELKTFLRPKIIRKDGHP